MREWGRSLLWRAAGVRSLPAFAGMRFKDWRWPVGPTSARRAAALVAAVLVAVLLGAFVLESGGLRAFLALPQGRILAPANDRNFGWIERAITQCDGEAARNVDTLYFLVIPVVATDDPQAWDAKSNGTVGDSVVLLGSQDTVEGLKAGSLRLARRAFEFSILDTSTSKVYKWKTALGVQKFAIRDAKPIATFKPGFGIPAGTDARWADGGTIPREAGICYWTGALIRG